jgi:hypothetical protein
MRQYYTKDIIVHGKGTVRRMQQMVVMDESKKKIPTLMETKCSCSSHIFVKLGSDKKYQIDSMF